MFLVLARTSAASIGLREYVVGPGIERLDPDAAVAAGRNHHNWYVREVRLAAERGD